MIGQDQVTEESSAEVISVLSHFRPNFRTKVTKKQND